MHFLTNLSRNRKLTISWLILAFIFFSSGVVLIVVSSVFRMQEQEGLGVHTLRSLVVGQKNLTAGIVAGAFILVCLVLGLYGFVDGLGIGGARHDTGMIAFSWGLVGTTLVTLAVASFIWIFSLEQRANFEAVWLLQDATTQAFLQNSLSCCGYWNATTSGLLDPLAQTGFCETIANVTAVVPCVTPITQFSDYFLNNVFTTIYGFTAIETALFLVSCCLIISRREEERFRKLDEKLGLKGGFVSEPYDPYIPGGNASQNPTGAPTPGGSKTAAIQQQIDDTVGIMRENITKVAERGERLDALQDKTDNLAQSAQGFRKGANRVRKQMWWKDMKMRLLIGVGIAVLVIIIVVPIVVKK